jgi:predicted nucleic acid-binding Zn finger protein
MLYGSWNYRKNEDGIKRLKAAKKINSKKANIRKINNYAWFVKSASSNSTGYLVNIREKTCTCSDYAFRKEECKHIKAVKQRINGDKPKKPTMREQIKRLQKRIAQLESTKGIK